MVFSVGIAAYAQDVPPGFLARLDFTQRLEYSDNPRFVSDGESDFFGRTILGFALDSETSVDRLSFSLGAQIDQGRNDFDPIDLRNANTGLLYRRDTGNANVGVNLRYRFADNDPRVTDDEFEADSDVIDQSDGSRQTFRVGLNGAFGVNAPVGVVYSLDYSEIQYFDTLDPNLNDRSTLRFEGDVIFRVNPLVSGRLISQYLSRDTSGTAVDREEIGLGVGATFTVNPRLVADVTLRYDEITLSGSETGANDGLSGELDLTQTMPNGTLGLSFGSDVVSNADGRRSFLRISRALNISRNASLSISPGVTYSESTGADPLLDLSYDLERPTSRISVNLAQFYTFSDQNEERINTTLGARYDQRINSLSSFGASLNVFNRNELGFVPNDGDSLTVGLDYRHDLTRDWGLVTGYRYRRALSDTTSNRTSNTVFVGLQRAFNWTP